ncbi:MAG: glycine betaine ABC transporter substrate-binding protein [Vicinamibacterales bacterium]
MTATVRRVVLGLAGLAAVVLAAPGASGQARPADPSRPVVVGSKPFGESYLLAEIFAQVIESRGLTVTRRLGLGSTDIAFPALARGEIDVYPEYTGTGLLVILKAPLSTDRQVVFNTVARETERRYDVRWLPPLGFENTYAMSVRTDMAARLGLRTLSDVARVSETLRAGFTADFVGRADGLPKLRDAYGLAPRSVRVIAPALKYPALAQGEVDIIDAFSTDGLLSRYPLTVLEDDQHVFPPYDAAPLVRGAVAREHPGVVAALSRLGGRLDVERMRRLNARLEVEGDAVGDIAHDALVELGLVAPRSGRTVRTTEGDLQAAPAGADGSFLDYLWAQRQMLAAKSARHLSLTGLSMVAAIVVGVGLGLSLTRAAAAEAATRGVGLLQTMPGIALLAFMLPVLGIGIVPSIAALFLYSLYPIVRGTVTGVRQADPQAVEAATALGMTGRQVLWWVRVPLAMPVIMAGIRTAAVTNVGTATLAAFVGGGGLGDPIVAGLALADSRMILSGAIPAALLAVVVDVVLARVQRWLTPAALR